jgi:hypothetical protein
MPLPINLKAEDRSTAFGRVIFGPLMALEETEGNAFFAGLGSADQETFGAFTPQIGGNGESETERLQDSDDRHKLRMAEIYRRKVSNLAAALGSAETCMEASELIRILVERIT